MDASKLAVTVRACILARNYSSKEWQGPKYPKNERLDASKGLASKRATGNVDKSGKEQAKQRFR